jgi:putative peptidoglycan lipid II flippase
VQETAFVTRSSATREQGAESWLNSPFRALQLPIGVFCVAIATVSTTRFADAAVDEVRAKLSRLLVEGLRLVAFLCVPATVGLIVLGEPVIRLIYERGYFRSWDTEATTRALDLYVVGLVAYAAVKVLAPAFYAVKLTRIAVYASIAAVAANVILNLFLHPIYGYKILALGTALAAIVNCAILYVGFHRRIAPIPHLALVIYLLRIGLAAAVMGGATWGVSYLLDGLLGHASFAARCADAMIPVVVGAGVYALACAVLGIEELHQFVGKLRRAGTV